MKNIVDKVFPVLMLLMVSIAVFAESPGAPPATPIDGGLSLLLTAGGIYGVKKIAKAIKD